MSGPSTVTCEFSGSVGGFPGDHCLRRAVQMYDGLFLTDL